MGFQDRIRESLTGGSGGSDPPEYGCNACRNRFNSNRSPRHARCPECDSGDVELLANPDRAEGSHPLDPRSDDDGGDSGDADATPADAAADASSVENGTSSDATAAPADATAETASDGATGEPDDAETDESDDAVTDDPDDAVTDDPDDAVTDDPDDDEAAAVRELMTTGQYRCQDCREAFDQDGPELACPDCGSTDIKERF